MTELYSCILAAPPPLYRRRRRSRGGERGAAGVKINAGITPCPPGPPLTARPGPARPLPASAAPNSACATSAARAPAYPPPLSAGTRAAGPGPSGSCWRPGPGGAGPPLCLPQGLGTLECGGRRFVRTRPPQLPQGVHNEVGGGGGIPQGGGVENTAEKDHGELSLFLFSLNNKNKS